MSVSRNEAAQISDRLPDKDRLKTFVMCVRAWSDGDKGVALDPPRLRTEWGQRQVAVFFERVRAAAQEMKSSL